MKKLLLIFGLCCSVNLLSAQTASGPCFQDVSHNVLANYQGGSLFDPSSHFVGQFKSENNRWDIIDHNHNLIGYIINDNQMVDVSNNPVGYLVQGPSYSTIVQDKNHNVMGNIQTNGTVQSTTRGIIGYNMHLEPMWAAAYFLLYRF